MGIKIHIDDGLYSAAKKIASAESRSIPQQIEFWATVEKCALDNPELPIAFLIELLKSKLLDRSLTEPFNFL